MKNHVKKMSNCAYIKKLYKNIKGVIPFYPANDNSNLSKTFKEQFFSYKKNEICRYYFSCTPESVFFLIKCYVHTEL